MGIRFKKARFHIDSGPQSLFDRIRFKMDGRRVLKVHATHLRRRASERSAPLELLSAFEPSTWRLVQAEARTDTGKFISTTWSVATPDGTWWVVVGLHDTIETVYQVEDGRGGRSPDIIRDGPLYQLVDSVNHGMMEAEEPGSC